MIFALTPVVTGREVTEPKSFGFAISLGHISLLIKIIIIIIIIIFIS